MTVFACSCFCSFLTFLWLDAELSTPLILSFTDAKTLSLMLTIALGIVVSSLYLGVRNEKE